MFYKMMSIITGGCRRLYPNAFFGKTQRIWRKNIAWFLVSDSSMGKLDSHSQLALTNRAPVRFQFPNINIFQIPPGKRLHNELEITMWTMGKSTRNCQKICPSTPDPWDRNGPVNGAAQTRGFAMEWTLSVLKDEVHSQGAVFRGHRWGCGTLLWLWAWHYVANSVEPL